MPSPAPARSEERVLPPNVTPVSDFARVLAETTPGPSEAQERTRVAVAGLVELAGTVRFHDDFDTDRGRWRT